MSEIELIDKLLDLVEEMYESLNTYKCPDEILDDYHQRIGDLHKERRKFDF